MYQMYYNPPIYSYQRRCLFAYDRPPASALAHTTLSHENLFDIAVLLKCFIAYLIN